MSTSQTRRRQEKTGERERERETMRKERERERQRKRETEKEKDKEKEEGKEKEKEKDKTKEHAEEILQSEKDEPENTTPTEAPIKISLEEKVEELEEKKEKISENADSVVLPIFMPGKSTAEKQMNDTINSVKSGLEIFKNKTDTFKEKVVEKVAEKIDEVIKMKDDEDVNHEINFLNSTEHHVWEKNKDVKDSEVDEVEEQIEREDRL